MKIFKYGLMALAMMAMLAGCSDYYGGGYVGNTYHSHSHSVHYVHHTTIVHHVVHHTTIVHHTTVVHQSSRPTVSLKKR